MEGVGSSGDSTTGFATKRKRDEIEKAAKSMGSTPETIERARQIEAALDPDSELSKQLDELIKGEKWDEFWELVTSDKGLRWRDKAWLNPKKAWGQLLAAIGLGAGAVSVASALIAIRKATKVVPRDAVFEGRNYFQELMDADIALRNGILTPQQLYARLQSGLFYQMARLSAPPEYFELWSHLKKGDYLRNDELQWLVQEEQRILARAAGHPDITRVYDYSDREVPQDSMSDFVNPKPGSWYYALAQAQALGNNSPIVKWLSKSDRKGTESLIKAMKATQTGIHQETGNWTMIAVNEHDSMFIGDMVRSPVYIRWAQAPEVGELWGRSQTIPNSLSEGKVPDGTTVIMVTDPRQLRGLISVLPPEMRMRVSRFLAVQASGVYLLRNEVPEKLRGFLFGIVNKTYSAVSSAYSAFQLWQAAQRALRKRED